MRRKSKYLILSLVLTMTFIMSLTSIQGPTVEIYTFTDKRINSLSWENLQDCDMDDGEQLLLEFTIADVSTFETYLEVLIDSPSTPNYLVETIGFSDLQNLKSNGTTLSYLWIVDLGSGDQEGWTQFKLHAGGNWLGWVEVTGEVKYYKNDEVNKAPDFFGISLDQSDNKIEIRYDATDSEGDSFLFSLYYAKDGITFVNALVVDTTNRYYAWDTSDLPSGNFYRIKIVVKDEHGATNEYFSSTYSIIGYERVTILTPSETATDTESQTVTVTTNFDNSVELFVNEISKGSKTTSLSWNIVLSSGTNEILIVSTTDNGIEIKDTHYIKLLRMITDVQSTEAKLTDGDIISNLHRGPSIDASHQASVHLT